MNTLLQLGTTVIEFIGAAIVLTYVCQAVYALVSQGLLYRRQIGATGALTGPDFKVAVTLIKTNKPSSWNQIGVFIAVFAMRCVLKIEFFEISKTVTICRVCDAKIIG